jgi:hypothetical protein
MQENGNKSRKSQTNSGVSTGRRYSTDTHGHVVDDLARMKRDENSERDRLVRRRRKWTFMFANGKRVCRQHIMLAKTRSGCTRRTPGYMHSDRTNGEQNDVPSGPKSSLQRRAYTARFAQKPYLNGSIRSQQFIFFFMYFTINDDYSRRYVKQFIRNFQRFYYFIIPIHSYSLKSKNVRPVSLQKNKKHERKYEYIQ